jgi:hypothetical protein
LPRVAVDRDADGVPHPMVVVTSLTGDAAVRNFGTTPATRNFIMTIENICETPRRAEVTIRFVDMLAAGFNRDEPSTWTFRRVPAARVDFNSDFVNGTRFDVTAASSNGASAVAFNGMNVIFSHREGVAEIRAFTDYTENLLDNLRLFIQPPNTRFGSNVSVILDNGRLTFANVHTPGNSFIASKPTTSAVPLPSNTVLCGPKAPASYFLVETDAETSGEPASPSQVCINYADLCLSAPTSFLTFQEICGPNGCDRIWRSLAMTVDANAKVACAAPGSNPFILVGAPTNVDTTPPVFAPTPSAFTQATSPAGALITYAVTASDDQDPNPVVVCLPPSGTVFPIGQTVVRCTATDAAGNVASASFVVTVVDGSPTCSLGPIATRVTPSLPAGAIVTFTVAGPNVPVACSPASGTVFPIGQTLVRCSAVDEFGNTCSASFTVTVKGPGESCSGQDLCATGFCVDGVCCASECGQGVEDCQACSVAAGGTANGTCTPLTTTPVCRQKDGSCDVEERCVPNSTDCPANAFVADGTTCGTTNGSVCDVAGTCSSGVCGSNTFSPGTLCYETGGDLCASVQQKSYCTDSSPDCPPRTDWPANGCVAASDCADSSLTCPPRVAGCNVELLGGLCDPGGVSVTFDPPVAGGDVAAQGPDQFVPAAGECLLPPTGFAVVKSNTDSNGQYWNIDVSEGFVLPGTTTICVHYTPDPFWLGSFNECGLQLFHGENAAPAGGPCTPKSAGWKNINAGGMGAVCPSSGIKCGTTPPETCEPKNTICGTLMAGDHFSPFAVFAPLPTFAPTVTVPGDMTVEATSPGGAAVTFVATATDPTDGPLDPVCTPASGSTFAITTTTVTCTATNSLGIEASASFTVTVQDTTRPVFTNVPGTKVAAATSTAGAIVTYTLPTATDSVGGPVPVSCTPASGSTFAPGQKTVECTASDVWGNTATASFVVWVQFQPADGAFFLPPIDAAGARTFNAGSTIPVKFKLTGASAGIKNLVARLTMAKIVNGAVGPYQPAEATPPCDANTFRYDPATRQYIFNLSTKKMSKGTWSLRADLGDLVDHTINVTLR